MRRLGVYIPLNGGGAPYRLSAKNRRSKSADWLARNPS